MKVTSVMCLSCGGQYVVNERSGAVYCECCGAPVLFEADRKKIEQELKKSGKTNIKIKK